MSETITTQEQELTQQSLTVVERAKAIVITNQETYNAACSFLLDVVKPFRRNWKAYWYGSDAAPGPIKLAYSSYNSLLDKFNERDDPAEVAEKTVKQATLVWEAAQEKLTQERQRVAQEEADRNAEEERLHAAIVAEQSGASDEEVEAIVQAPVMAIAAPVAPTFQRAAGMSKPRDNWKCRVISVVSLCKAIGSGKLKFARSDEIKVAEFFATLLAKKASADKSTLNIPGVVPYNDPIAATRRR